MAREIRLQAVEHRQTEDSRLARLQSYLEVNDCPLNKLAADFIEAADREDLDWRLLPSIAMIESSGGKFYTNNNVFGWDSCRERFPSVKAGIHIVADRLANWTIYKDKDLDTVLRTYNPERRDYPRKVKAVMEMIGSTEVAAANQIN